ncbi:site-specific recombinase, DNA invertase Pin [Mycolicibacterium phlei]|uniref:Resolvase n=1 Tax=Mycolicibacterium phlei DSM 43239 = CCUG 21000 TaxID=1226750 RepID=A0A5N5UU28_MYCPH|nr:recombinase family protein [Mycolicibacterium phlei]VEG10981.1 site-specific recombinase, DNA invertase Pin [Mycobacteroides chelonae]AMO62881.1 DNA-invertase hin [Mycolicibacterium phlei]KAB7752009.1 resolvase [Mycolicibacterium phlei DSM 43239 = CCUG 21000]KXW59533.1 resolvase [Mycolicibacterium phlei DSM 43072]KXW59900.1 resolvase [Mycolicibacterium phlei DSM 43070]
MTCTLGYATATAVEQDLDGQLAALGAAGVDPRRVFTDRLAESADRARAGLHAMLSYARSGDTVIVVALDRLGRTGTEVTRTVTELTDRGIRLRTLREGLDTATATGRMVADILAKLARLDAQPAHRARRDG